MTTDDSRQSSPGARLLIAERAAIMPILRRMSTTDFDRPTICTGWSVRDVLAHCAAALTRLAGGTLHGFTPEENQRDVEERRSWPLAQVLDELDRGYAAASQTMASGGPLEVIALGEWVHGGDVREALGLQSAYASEGTEDALALLARCSRRRAPPTDVYLRDRDMYLRLGPEPPAELTARMTADTETLIRLCTGRHPVLSRLAIDGAEPAAYLILS